MKERLSPDTQYFLRRLADQVPSMLAYWDTELRCRFANQAYERWFGVDPDALLGRSLRELLGPELFALNEPYIASALAGQAQVFERLVPGPDGVERASLAHYLPDIQDARVRGFVVQVTEVTAIKAVEAALRDSELRFRTLAESSPSGVYYADTRGLTTYANARWMQIHGLDGAAALGDGWTRALHPADLDRVLENWRAAVAACSEFDMEYRVLAGAERVRNVRTRARPVRNADGGCSGFVGVLDDITEQRATEQRLRASEHFLDRTGRVAGVGGWQADLRTRRVDWTTHTRRIHEVDADYQPDFLGSPAFYPPAAWAQVEQAAASAIRDGTSWDLELPFITAQGRDLWVRVLGEVEYEDGVPARLIGAFQDITENRRHKAELLREHELRIESERHAAELSQLLQERGEMLDVLAHEVRQPLNNASAALQSAAATLTGLKDTLAADRLKRAQTVIGQVLASIDNTLAVASLLARPDPIQPADADIDTLLAVAAADMPAEQRRRIVINRATPSRTASMDMSLMRLALRNLLSNALRYSPPDTAVLVRVTDSDEPLGLIIDVQDSGTGVPAGSVARLFERGAQARANLAPPHGMGLGLYIVRRVMELHRGQALLLRNGADGATFRLVLEQPGDE